MFPKKYGTGESALADVTLTIDSGEFVFMVGPSGSGKTTLFKLLIREILPTQGNIHVNDWNITKLSRGKIPHLRRRIGVVFQDLKLLTDRTIFENILLPLQIAGVDNKKAHGRVTEVMSQVGIESHRNKFPVQLSGGELQRVAIARAIVFMPEIVIADEPTGNLDAVTSWEIVKLLHDINAAGTTVLMATHNTDIIRSMGKRVVTLEKGQVVRDELTGKPAPKDTADESTETVDKKEKTEPPAEHKAHTVHAKKHKKEDAS